MAEARALVYDPYLTTLGGGERYAYSLADVLQRHFDTSMAAPELPDHRRLELLGFHSSVPVSSVPLEAFTDHSRTFDLSIILTNQIPPASSATRKFAVVQFPFDSVGSMRHPRSYVARRRCLMGYGLVVYSKYCRAWTERRWHRRADVLPPSIDVDDKFAPVKKVTRILAVGRFCRRGHGKRQDVLIDAYRQLPADVLRSWELCLVGTVERGTDDVVYLEELRRRADGLNVKILVDLGRSELTDLFATASIFWHAAGFGRPIDKPEMAEHFGMSTVEAMSFGCVPLVYDDGGQSDLVDDSFGRKWRSVDELRAMTTRLVHDSDTLAAAASRARAAAQLYSHDAFRHRCEMIFVRQRRQAVDHQEDYLA